MSTATAAPTSYMLILAQGNFRLRDRVTFTPQDNGTVEVCFITHDRLYSVGPATTRIVKPVQQAREVYARLLRQGWSRF